MPDRLVFLAGCCIILSPLVGLLTGWQWVVIADLFWIAIIAMIKLERKPQ